MSDIFREVEEEVRRERYAKLWKQYGDYVIALLALIILAAAGFQVWRFYQHKARLAASSQYQAAEMLFETGHPAQAATAFAKLADTGPSGYAILAKLQNADALAASGSTDTALNLYKQLATTDNALIAAVARLREGWILAETTPRLQLEALLAPLTGATSPWRFMAREILAYADYRAGKFDAARKEYQALGNEIDAPIGVRQRASAMAGFLKAGGDNNFGSVPAAAPQAQAAGTPADATAGAAPAAPAATPPAKAEPKAAHAPHKPTAHRKGQPHR